MMLGFIVFISENCSSCNRSSCKCPYDICDGEHYYNTLHRNYTIAELVFSTYFKPNYFINPFEVVFGCFLCLKMGIVVAISNWK